MIEQNLLPRHIIRLRWKPHPNPIITLPLTLTPTRTKKQFITWSLGLGVVGINAEEKQNRNKMPEYHIRIKLNPACIACVWSIFLNVWIFIHEDVYIKLSAQTQKGNGFWRCGFNSRQFCFADGQGCCQWPVHVSVSCVSISRQSNLTQCHVFRANFAFRRMTFGGHSVGDDRVSVMNVFKLVDVSGPNVWAVSFLDRLAFSPVPFLGFKSVWNTPLVADPEQQAPYPLKFDRLCFIFIFLLSHFVSECLKIRLR